MKVAFDFETVKLLPDGTKVASPDFWHPDFRVDSCAFTWREPDTGELKSLFIQGEDAVGEQLRKHAAAGDEMVCHNLGFEYGVMICRYPDVKFDNYIDTMRLVQLYDGGGSSDDFEWVVIEEEVLEPSDRPKLKRTPLQGLGLAKSARRILGLAIDPKDEAHSWIMDNVPECKKKNKAGSYLHLLPSDILERYNISDTENTLNLYTHITNKFRRDGYDWTMDHLLYVNTCKRVAESKIRGVPIDRAALESYRLELMEKIKNIGAEFRAKFQTQIEQLEHEWDLAWIHSPKTYRGRCVRFVQWHDGEFRSKFNVGSNKQLGELFQNKLGITPRFFTDKGSPSFKSSVLGQWGEGGDIIKARRKLLLVLKQTEALLELSKDDGHWHLGLKVASTATGRMAGGG